MNSSDRRNKIKEILKSTKEPIKGTSLASMMDVTRQVIVQDIAILRAKGLKVLSTPQGYVLDESVKNRCKKIIASKHYFDRTEEELNIIVDNGGNVLDVIVEHPFYGELKGLLMLSSRYDIAKFVECVKDGKAMLLSSLTEGVHLHTIEADSNETLERIENKLRERGFLVE